MSKAVKDQHFCCLLQKYAPAQNAQRPVAGRKEVHTIAACHPLRKSEKENWELKLLGLQHDQMQMQ